MERRWNRRCFRSSAAALALFALAASRAQAAEPVNYWNVRLGGDVWTEGNLKLDDGSVAAWTNGNFLIAGSSEGGRYPEAVCATKENFRSIVISADLSAYGVKYRSGGGVWSGSGVLTIGAGGYDADTAWNNHYLKMAGVRLAASQTWHLNNRLWVKCPVSAVEGAELTLTIDAGSFGWNGQNAVMFSSPCSLPNVGVVVSGYTGIGLWTADAALNAKSLRLVGANALLLRTEASGNVVDSRYAKVVEFADGAIPQMSVASSDFDSVEGPKCTNTTDIVFGADLEGVRVVSGAVSLGASKAYSVQDGAALTVEVAAGATLTVAAPPTEGRLVAKGAGALYVVPEALSSIDVSGFVGTVQTSIEEDATVASLVATYGDVDVRISDSVVRIDSVAGYTKTLTLTGATRVALPRTADWPAGMSVVADAGAEIYLPSGEEVDSTKISGGTVKAVGRGMTAEGDVSVSTGAELVVCGDGFASGTTLTLNGGTLLAPFDVEIGSDVVVAKKSAVRALKRTTATASGSWSWADACELTVSNENENASAGAEDRNGRWAFTGRGEATLGGYNTNTLYVTTGDLVFSGKNCRWNLGGGCKIRTSTSGPRYIGVLDGAQLTFDDLAGDNWALRDAMCVGGNGGDMTCLEVGRDSALVFGKYRGFAMGSQASRCHATLRVSGGLVRFDGTFGFFATAGSQADWQLKDTSDDRCPEMDILVTDGGVVETDRAFAISPVTHHLDSPARNFAEGAFLTLDGGTYRVGRNFGATSERDVRNWARNALFVGANTTERTASLHTTNYVAEIMVTIGEKGGTFDFSQAKEGVASITNTILGARVPAPKIEGGLAPTLGPRWTLNGCLTVKGRGGQEFVVNGLDAAALKKLRADGAVVKVLSDSAAALDEMTLGSPAGGGLVVETTNAAPERLAVSIASLAVAADGFFDASFFDAERTAVGSLSFGEGATLCARGNPVAAIPVSGAVTLASKMGYWAANDAPRSATVLTAGSVVAPEGGVEWTKREGSRNRSVVATATAVEMKMIGTVLIVR